MADINLTVRKGRLKKKECRAIIQPWGVDHIAIIQYTWGVDHIVFDFDEDWDGFTKFVYFKQWNEEVKVPLENNRVVIPNQFADKTFYIEFMVYGTKPNAQITTNTIQIKIGETFDPDTPAGEPTQGLFYIQTENVSQLRINQAGTGLEFKDGEIWKGFPDLSPLLTRLDTLETENAKLKAYRDRKWELIETRVLENEVDTVIFETEPDSTPYKFDKLRFFIECPAKPGTQFGDSYIYINSANIYIGVYEFIDSAQKNTSVFEISLDENKFIKCDRFASALGDISDTSPLINKDVGFIKNWHSVALTNIHRVRIDSRAVGSELPVGTVITVWGTRSVE